MFLIRDLPAALSAPAAKPSVLALGNFDGVHVGHQAMFQTAVAAARARGITSAALSFFPSPQEFFQKDSASPRLTSVRQKLLAMRQCGLDGALLLRFGERFAHMPAAQFVDDILVRNLRAVHLVVGADFRFGYQRRGDVALLRELGPARGFGVEVQPDVKVGGERVSSSAIRSLLSSGNFSAARSLLGRPFTISGHVAHGRKLGRTLGFPTLNVPLRRGSPVAGIFAVRVHGLGPAAWPGVASLGTRPSVEVGGSLILETTVLDWQGDAYGQRVDVEFVAKLRDESRFDGLEALRSQMERDRARALEILSER